MTDQIRIFGDMITTEYAHPTEKWARTSLLIKGENFDVLMSPELVARMRERWWIDEVSDELTRAKREVSDLHERLECQAGTIRHLMGEVGGDTPFSTHAQLCEAFRIALGLAPDAAIPGNAAQAAANVREDISALQSSLYSERAHVADLKRQLVTRNVLHEGQAKIIRDNIATIERLEAEVKRLTGELEGRPREPGVGLGIVSFGSNPQDAFLVDNATGRRIADIVRLDVNVAVGEASLATATFLLGKASIHNVSPPGALRPRYYATAKEVSDLPAGHYLLLWDGRNAKGPGGWTPIQKDSPAGHGENWRSLGASSHPGAGIWLIGPVPVEVPPTSF